MRSWENTANFVMALDERARAHAKARARDRLAFTGTFQLVSMRGPKKAIGLRGSPCYFAR